MFCTLACTYWMIGKWSSRWKALGVATASAARWAGPKSLTRPTIIGLPLGPSSGKKAAGDSCFLPSPSRTAASVAKLEMVLKQTWLRCGIPRPRGSSGARRRRETIHAVPAR